MSRTALLVVAVLLSSLSASCGSSSSSTAGTLPTTPLVLTASASSVVANGSNTVTISLSGPAQGEVSVSTDRGTFGNGLSGVRVATLPATVTLVSCNASTESGCSGVALVRAADRVGTYGETQVTFTGGSGPTATCTTCGSTACVGVVCDDVGHTCSTGSPSTCSTCPGGTTEICNDGVDNNCDGFVDCADPQCQPVGNALGAACDSKGNTCSVKGVTGASTCSICSGNGGTAQAHETLCGDGKDNDCDGLVDCQDPDCAGLTCSAGGLTCSATALTCSVCPGGQAVETTCGDGKDNDCNGLIDCKDPACQPTTSGPGKTCGAFGQTCTSAGGGTCTCSGNGGVAQTTETSCGDGFDNDCNGKVDCEDTACAQKSCDRNGSVGKLCTGGVCTCPGGTAEVCNDGVDNDCNGLIDCLDPACQPAGATPGASCDSRGNRCSAPSAGVPSSCSVCSGNGGVAQAVEASCSDGFDNDCDGLIDCADSSCLGQPCSAANPSYVCLTLGSQTSCADPGTRYTLELVPARTRIPADGSASTNVVATLRQDGVPLAGKTVVFTSTLTGTAISTAALTDANGQTTAVFSSTDPDVGGDATIRATYVASPSVTVAGTTLVSLPRLGQVNLLTQQYDILGVRSSEYQETSVLTFQLLDSADLPYPAGLAVDFTHVSLAQSFIGLTPANCSATVPVRCTLRGTTDAQGRVQVLLNSGYAAGVVSVAAGASAGGISASGSASNIAIVGAKASGAHITMECYNPEPAGVKPQVFPAFTDADCSFSHLMELANCRVALADRFNNVLGVSTLAQFFSEAGTAGPAAFTPQYNPAMTPAQQTDLGLATSYVRTDGKLPIDVRPFPGERSVSYSGVCPIVEANPRDGLVTVIVVANGEEGFVDLNGNGEYDAGEPFIDMGEPFIDENDDGAWQPGEFFVDLNHNGIRDEPDGLWNRNTVIWAEARILFTSYFANASFYSGPLSNPSLASPFAVDGATPGPATTQTVKVVFADANLNPTMVPPFPTTFSVDTTTGHASAAFAQEPLASQSLRLDQAISFTQRYCSTTSLGPSCANVCPTAPCYVVTNVGACDATRTTCTGFSYGASGQVAITGVSTGTDTVTATVKVEGRAVSTAPSGPVR